MAKEKVIDVEAEVESVEELEKEVEEAKKAPPTKTPFFTKDRMVRYGKNALKVAVGGLVGFGTAVFLGWTMGRDSDDSYDYEPPMLDEGDSEEEYEE